MNDENDFTNSIIITLAAAIVLFDAVENTCTAISHCRYRADGVFFGIPWGLTVRRMARDSSDRTSSMKVRSLITRIMATARLRTM